MIQSALILLFSLLLFFTASVAYADEAIITNIVNVSSNSGGNSSINESVVEGRAVSKIETKTVINGEIVEKISLDGDGESIELFQKIDFQENAVEIDTKISSSSRADKIDEIEDIKAPTEKEALSLLDKLSFIISYVISFFKA